MRSLAGQVGIVTGAAYGLGREYAVALARQGCALVVCDLSEAVFDTAQLIEHSQGEALPALADVSAPVDVRRVVDAAIARFGRIDFLINNAAVMRSSTASDDLDKSLADYEALVPVNLKGVFLFGRAVIPHMVRRSSGHIINIATDHVHTHPGRPTGGRHARMDLYDATKWGVLGLTCAWAEELKQHGVRVNCFSMGATDTPMVRRFFESPTPEQTAGWLRPADLSALAVELLAEGRDGRSGENIGCWIGFNSELRPIPTPGPTASRALFEWRS